MSRMTGLNRLMLLMRLQKGMPYIAIQSIFEPKNDPFINPISDQPFGPEPTLLIHYPINWFNFSFFTIRNENN